VSARSVAPGGSGSGGCTFTHCSELTEPDEDLVALREHGHRVRGGVVAAADDVPHTGVGQDRELHRDVMARRLAGHADQQVPVAAAGAVAAGGGSTLCQGLRRSKASLRKPMA